MKTKLLLGLLLVANMLIGQATNDDLRLNLSIGTFSSGGAGDFTGAVGVVGSTGFMIDSVKLGDVLVDDLHNRYEVAGITIIVQGSSATLELSCLDSPCAAPQSGKGLLFRPTSNLGLELLTENGSNFITEGLEAKVLTHNFLEIDRLLGQSGNGLITALPDGNVNIDALGNDLLFNNLNNLTLNTTSFLQLLSQGNMQLGVVGGGDLSFYVNNVLSAPAGALMQRQGNFAARYTPYAFNTNAPPSNGKKYYSSWLNGTPAWDTLPVINTSNFIINQTNFPNFANTSANAGFFKNALGRLGFQHGNTGGSSGIFSVNGLGGISRMTLYSTTDTLDTDYSSIVIENDDMVMGTYQGGTESSYVQTTTSHVNVGGSVASTSYEYPLENSDPPSDGNPYSMTWTNGVPGWTDNTIVAGEGLTKTGNSLKLGGTMTSLGFVNTDTHTFTFGNAEYRWLVNDNQLSLLADNSGTGNSHKIGYGEASDALEISTDTYLQIDGEVRISSDIVRDVLNDVRDVVGAGSPEGAVTAGIGSIYRRTDGGAGTTLYVKESGTGNTGWVAK